MRRHLIGTGAALVVAALVLVIAHNPAGRSGPLTKTDVAILPATTSATTTPVASRPGGTTTVALTAGATTHVATSGAVTTGVTATLVSAPRGATTAVSSAAPHAAAPNQPAAPDRTAVRHAVAMLGQLPLRFEANHGQFDPATRFAARGLRYGLALTATEAVLALHSSSPSSSPSHEQPAARTARSPRDASDNDEARATAGPGPAPADPSAAAPAADRRATLRLSLLGANASAQPAGLDPLPGVTHHYRGADPDRWQHDVPAFARVRYTGVYDGIDLVYHGNQQRLEYDFELAPGADPDRIRLRVDGASRVALDDDSGDLILHASAGDGGGGGGIEPVRQQRPIAYQQIDGTRVPVDSRYTIDADGSIGFALGDYDRRAPLTIDPVLIYSTFFGGTSEESIFDIALDPAGNIYVTGRTEDQSGFPTTPGALQPTKPAAGFPDAFVAKFNPAGSALIYSTFLGGSGNDCSRAQLCGRIAVDAAGNAYLAGDTSSADFPTTPGAFDTTYGGGNANPSDAYYVKLGPTGALLYGTYMGGSDFDWATGIAVDAAGNAYISGTTASDVAEGFSHTANAYDGTLNQQDAFLAKFDAAGTRVYSTLIGGTGAENSFLVAGGGIAVDDQGRAYITGDTYAPDFPIVNGRQATFGGNYDAYLVKIDTTVAGPAGLLYSTYFGGPGQDLPYSIAYAGNGQVVIVGEADPGFPTLNALDASYNGGNSDAFIAKFDTTQTGAASLLFSTYLGGANPDIAYDVAVDPAGNIHLTGSTASTDFPLVDPISSHIFLTQPFVAKLNAAGTALIYSTYFGGEANGKLIGAVAATGNGDTFIAGNTNTDRANPPFPLGQPMVNPFQSTYGGGDRDAVIARIGTPPDPTDTDDDDLPNDWETRYGLDPNDSSGDNGRTGDPDGDGVTNEEELARGSHPRGFVITYLAEGATGSFFQTRLALANPTNSTALVLTRFQRADGTVIPLYTPIAPHARATVDVQTLAGLESADFATLIEADVQVVADRTMTWDHSAYGSHAERGILTRTATTWYLAEGATHGGFTLFYLLQNPGDAAAEVEITYLLPAPAPPTVRTYVVGPGSRMTIPVDDEPGLQETDVSGSLRSVNGVPFVAERAMYFSRPGQAFAGGHESAGVTAPATRWFLAEGATGTFFNMFVLIANPSAQPADVQMQYLLTDGQVITRTHVIDPQSRVTLNVALEDPLLSSAALSTIVTSTNNVPIVVERAMWWPAPAQAAGTKRTTARAKRRPACAGEWRKVNRAARRTNRRTS